MANKLTFKISANELKDFLAKQHNVDPNDFEIEISDHEVAAPAKTVEPTIKKSNEMISYINRHALKIAMFDAGLHYDDMARKLSISRTAFANKVTGIPCNSKRAENRQTSFTEREIIILIQMFGTKIINKEK